MAAAATFPKKTTAGRAQKAETRDNEIDFLLGRRPPPWPALACKAFDFYDSWNHFFMRDWNVRTRWERNVLTFNCARK